MHWSLRDLLETPYSYYRSLIAVLNEEAQEREQNP